MRPERSCPLLFTQMEAWKSGEAEGLAHLGKISPFIPQTLLKSGSGCSLGYTSQSASQHSLSLPVSQLMHLVKSLSVSSLPGPAARGYSYQQISQLYLRLGDVWFPKKFSNGLRLQLSDSVHGSLKFNTVSTREQVEFYCLPQAVLGVEAILLPKLLSFAPPGISINF